MKVVGLKFESFSTGCYDHGKYPGVTIQFVSEVNGSEYYVIFNVKLTRVRRSKVHAAGTPLPGKQFRVSKKSNFYKFWLRTGLRLPPRLSSFHDYMGNLGKLAFSGDVDAENKLITGSLMPMPDPAVVPEPDKSQPSSVLEADKWQTKYPYKHLDEPPSNSAPQVNLSTSCSNYERRLTGKADTSPAIRFPRSYKELQEQSVDDWLLDYESSEINRPWE